MEIQQPETGEIPLDWRSEIEVHRIQALAAKTASEAFLEGVQRQVYPDASPEEQKSIIRAQMICNEANSFDREKYDSIEQMIFMEYDPDLTKYADHSSGTEGSQRDETEEKTLAYDAEAAVLTVSKEPTFSSLYFVAKLVGIEGSDATLRVSKIKGVAKIIPQIDIIKIDKSFVFCSLQTRSDLMAFAIELCRGGRTILRSQQLRFCASLLIVPELKLAYDFTREEQLQCSPLEGTIAMCLLSDRDIVRQLLPRAVDVKTRLINNEQLQIDINTKSMILECKNVNTLLFLLTCLLENDNSQFGTIYPELQQPNCKQLVDIFLSLLVKYKPMNINEGRRAITPIENARVVKLYWHLICLNEKLPQYLTFRNQTIEDQKLLNAKKEELTEFLFREKQFPIFREILQFCRTQRSNVFVQGADCFRDYMREVSSSPDYILGGFLLVLHFRSKPKLEFFNFLFAGRSSEFETADIYRENIQNYRKLWWEIVEDIDLKSQKFDYFIIFYQIYRAFRANKYLSNFLEGEQGTKTKEKIVGFVSNIFEQIQRKEEQQQKIKGIKIIKLVLLTGIDEPPCFYQLESILKSQIQFIARYHCKQKWKAVLQCLMEEVYYQIMKKSTNYSKDFLENVSRSLSNCLTHFTHNVSLGIINKNFSEAVVNSELSLQIFSSCLLCPILERMFPYTQGSLEEPWHNEFAYQQLITEMLIEHKVRQIGRVLEDKHLKERKMNELKKEIDRYVGSRNPEQAEAYKAIVNMDLIQLETADIKRYLVSSHQFLPVLAKIMRRNDAKSIQIRSGFQEFSNSLEQMEASFDEIKGLHSLDQFYRIFMNRIQVECGTKVMERAEILYRRGDEYLAQLNDIKDFVLYASAELKAQDGLELVNEIDRQISLYKNESIKPDSISSSIPVFTRFNLSVMKCYRFESFYAQEKQLCRKEKRQFRIQEIIVRSSALLMQFEQCVNQVLVGFQNQTLSSKQILFFAPEKATSKQFHTILTMNQEETREVGKIVKIFELFKQARQIRNSLRPICCLMVRKFPGRYEEERKKLEGFSELCRSLLEANNFQVYDLCEQYEGIQQTLGTFNLHIGETVNDKVFRTLQVLVEEKNKADFFMNLPKKDIDDLKEKLNDEEGGVITYDDMVVAEGVVAFLQCLFRKQENMERFISEVMAQFTKNPRLARQLEHTFILQEKFQQELKNLRNRGRETEKTMEKVLDLGKFDFEVLSDGQKDVQVGELKVLVRAGEVIEEAKLYENKQKAILLLRKLENSTALANQERARKKQTIDAFLEMMKTYEQLKREITNLLKSGYILFSSSILMGVSHRELEECCRNIRRTRQKWNADMREFQKIHYKTSHLQGGQLRRFYQFLSNPSTKISHLEFSQIAQQEDFIGFKQHIRLNPQQENIIFETDNPQFKIRKVMEFITSFFLFLKRGLAAEEVPEDANQGFVHSCIIGESQVDALTGLKQLNTQRITNLKLEQVLFCSKSMHFLEVKSFIERTLLDNCSEYVILGYQHLSAECQQYIIDAVNQHRREKDKEDRVKLKLCLVGNSTIESIFKFFRHLPDIEFRQSNREQIRDAQQTFKDMLVSKTRNVRVVQSPAAGLGKTRWIQEQCARQGIRNIRYFTIAGELSEQFLFERIKEIEGFVAKLLEHTPQNPAFALVIQLYHIQPVSVTLVNKFLAQIALFKKFSSNGMTASICEHSSIYIELQNITHLKDQDRVIKSHMDTFPFLKLLHKEAHFEGHQIWHKSLLEHIQYDLDKQFSYVLLHLHKLHNKKINDPTESIDAYNQFQQINFDRDTIRMLLQKYFFSAFENERQSPSFYLLHYFKKILFDNCRAFSNSYFLSFANLQLVEQETKLRSQKLCTEMKILGTLRGQFLKTVVDNTVKFLIKSVSVDEFTTVSEINKKIENFPFFILPNFGGDSFSFVYTDPNSVPDSVRNFLLLQDSETLKLIGTQPLSLLFETHNLRYYEQHNLNKFNEQLSAILQNISGNQKYNIQSEPGYVVNLDNFFKMCLIAQRVRQNIPIVIIGEAGIGKTALLRHVVQYVYRHEFSVYNIHPGVTIRDLEKHMGDIKEKYNQLSKKNQQDAIKYDLDHQTKCAVTRPEFNRKLWVFFDQFNTMKAVGYFKEIIMEKRFLGQPHAHLENVVVMAACNPYRKLQEPNNQRETTLQYRKLAFDVLPPPHSLIDCMWNYGKLDNYEYAKYIEKMIDPISYRTEEVAKLLLLLHGRLTSLAGVSSVSLRDIERYRSIFKWFYEKLPKKRFGNLPLHRVLEERAFVMSMYFCYLLRLRQQDRVGIEGLIEQQMKMPQLLRKIKRNEEDDFCSRLQMELMEGIVLNDSLKQNLFTSFVCIYAKLPLIVLGNPGCSKSLSIRILLKHFQDHREDSYLRPFKNIRLFHQQGSQICLSSEIQAVFKRARQSIDPTRADSRDPFILFDEIGLAEKSADNPLKSIHPHLQLTRSNATPSIAFIGISNTELDISKMSRMLILRRPQPTEADLQNTAVGIAKFFESGKSRIALKIVEDMAKAYLKFVIRWGAIEANQYPEFFSLRDFYSLIKTFMKSLKEREAESSQTVLSAASRAIFRNFSGQIGSASMFRKIFFQESGSELDVLEESNQTILQSVVSAMSDGSQRYPLVIVDVPDGISYLSYDLSKRFREVRHIIGSPFLDDKQDRTYILRCLGEIRYEMEKPIKLIIDSLNGSVATVLYDFFNKFADEGGEKKIKLKLGGKIPTTVTIHNEFSCVYLVLNSELSKLDNPFLSRFEKYYFSCSGLARETCGTVTDRLESFIRDVQRICAHSDFGHYKAKNLFTNVSRDALNSLVLKLRVDFSNNQQLYKQALRSVIMNSTNDFCFIFKYSIRASGVVDGELVAETLEKKERICLGVLHNAIVFTSSPQLGRITESDAHRVIRVILEEKKSEQELQSIFKNGFFDSAGASSVQIMLRILEDQHKVDYIISLVQKHIQKARDINKDIDLSQKKVYLVFSLDRTRQFMNTSLQQGERVITEREVVRQDNCEAIHQISHLNPYRQVMLEERIEEIRNSKQDFLRNVADMRQLLMKANIEFLFQVPEARTDFLQFQQNLYSSPMLQRHAEEVICRIENSGFSLTEDNILGVLKQPDNLRKFLNLKQALAYSFGNNKFSKLVTLFLKFLAERESFLSYSPKDIFVEFAKQSLVFPEEEVVHLTGLRNTQSYCQLIEKILLLNIEHIASEYTNLKRLPKQLPDRRINVTLKQPRLFPFSKTESDIIFCKTENLNMSQFARKVVRSNDFKKNFNTFVEQLQNHSSFVLSHDQDNRVNLYPIINNDEHVKRMLFLDILGDFLKANGMPIQFTLNFQLLMMPFFQMIEDDKNGKNQINREPMRMEKDSKKVAIVSRSYRLVAPFSRMLVVLLGFESIWLQIFKIYSSFYEMGFTDIQPRHWQAKRITTQEMNIYCEKIFGELAELFTGKAAQKKFGGQVKFEKIFSNVMFQMERLEKIVDITLPGKLRSMRDLLVFLNTYSEEHKAQLFSRLLLQDQQMKLDSILNFLQELRQSSSAIQKELITQFQANHIFYKWFKQCSDHRRFLQCLIARCEDPLFAHNSVTTVSSLLAYLQIDYKSDYYQNIRGLPEKVEVAASITKEMDKLLDSQSLKSNIVILIVNIFIRSISEAQGEVKPVWFVNNQADNFVETVNNFNMFRGYTKLLALAFIKYFLTYYAAELLVKAHYPAMEKVDKVLTKETPIIINARFYCLKLMRKSLTLKELQTNYIKATHANWVLKMKDIFEEVESRALLVPNEFDCGVTPEMVSMMNEFTESQGGKVQLIPKLFSQAQKSQFNRYALLNFFLRYFYTRFYETAYKTQILNALNEKKAEFANVIGCIEMETILRYANSKFSEEINLSDRNNFNEDTFLELNAWNWLLATRKSVSALHSLFFTNGQLYKDFVQAWKSQYFPLGPQNPFVKNALSVGNMCRSVPVGVYMCSAECDFIYTHSNCGWPVDSTKCSFCGKQIGAKSNHVLCRTEEGARRITTKLQVDGNGSYYVSRMAKLTTYWEMIQKYIQAEANRMRLNREVKTKDAIIKLTGFEITCPQRIGRLTYCVLRMTMESIMYCLISMGLMGNDQCQTLFGRRGIKEAQVFLRRNTLDCINEIKKTLGIDNKVYGWIFGVQKLFFQMLMRFQGEFEQHVSGIDAYSQGLLVKVKNQIANNVITQVYFPLYLDMAGTIAKGMLTKQLREVKRMTAESQFTRDLMELRLQGIIRKADQAAKFDFGSQHMSLQGNMQFPHDALVTEDCLDEQDEKKFSMARVFKLPDKKVNYNQLLVYYELKLKNEYPLLDYALKNSESLQNMADFATIITFCNALANEVENNIQRREAETPVNIYLKELVAVKGNRVHQGLRNLPAVIEAWRRLAVTLGPLQNQCTIVGKMNEEMTQNEPIKAFLLDNTTKENPMGLIVSSIFHNFATMQNELTTILNAKKELIPKYKMVTLMNQFVKVHPQELKPEHIYSIPYSDYRLQLSHNSISSVIYGQNFVFNNFDAYQSYFVVKLNSKCEIIADIKKFRSICYNGEAFAASSDTSNALSELRAIFNAGINPDEKYALKAKLVKIKEEQMKQQREQTAMSIIRRETAEEDGYSFMIQLRGDLEKIMIALKKDRGANPDQQISMFIDKNQIDVMMELKETPFQQLRVAQIASLYELMEEQMKPYVLGKLHRKYKQKIDVDVQNTITATLKQLPRELDANTVTLNEFATALYRFIARILHSGIFLDDKKIFEYLPVREDFWPVNFETEKLYTLNNDPYMPQLTMRNICHLLDIVENINRS